MSALTCIDPQKPTYIFRFDKVKQILAVKHTITAYICIYLHLPAYTKSWECEGLAQVDEVREVDEVLKALEKRQVHI
jgi:hypothetical protein